MIRIFAYGVCLAGFLWLTLESVRFRQEIRTSLREADSRMQRAVPDGASDAGKILNSYYEAVYQHLPSVLWPTGMLMLGSTVLFAVGRRTVPNPALQATAAPPRI